MHKLALLVPSTEQGATCADLSVAVDFYLLASMISRGINELTPFRFCILFSSIGKKFVREATEP